MPLFARKRHLPVVGLVILGSLACVSSGDRTVTELRDNCRELAWRSERVPMLAKDGSIRSTLLRVLDRRSFESCVRAFGEDPALVGSDVIETADRMLQCRAETSVLLNDARPVLSGGVPHLVPDAYQSCVDSPQVSTQ